MLGILLGILSPFSLLAVFDLPTSIFWVTGTFFLAVAMLTGEDAFGMHFIEAFRAGKLD